MFSLSTSCHIMAQQNKETCLSKKISEAYNQELFNKWTSCKKQHKYNADFNANETWHRRTKHYWAPILNEVDKVLYVFLSSRILYDHWWMIKSLSLSKNFIVSGERSLIGLSRLWSTTSETVYTHLWTLQPHRITKFIFWRGHTTSSFLAMQLKATQKIKVRKIFAIRIW